MNRVALFAQLAFGVYVLWVAGGQSLKDVRGIRATATAEIRGMWTVSEFTEDGIVRPPLLTDSNRWRTVVLDHPSMLTVVSMNGDRARYSMQADGDKQFKLWNLADPKSTAVLLLDPQSDQMSLEGHFDGHPISAKMIRVDLSNPDKYPLINQGLRWVNPHIDNR